MKIIHFRGEFGEPCTMKAVCEGIYWNEMMERWSVHTEWGHAVCDSISQAKRTHRSRFTGEYTTLKDGSKFPVFSRPPILKGGHTHNHLYNVALRKVFRSKNRRDVNNNEKRHFRKLWEMNLKIGYHNSFCEFMEARAKKIKEGM